MTPDRQQELELLFDKMREDRVLRMRQVVRRRMKGLTVVLEALYDSGNRSAIYRSAEAFGLTDVHVVNPDAASKPHARSVSRGAEKWLDIHQHLDASECLTSLKERGFVVYAADLEAARPLETLDFTSPVALAFGNEHEGITDELRRQADGTFVIPMAGFTGSFNVSVAASIALQHARIERERALGACTDLTVEESEQLLLEFARRSAKWLRRLQERGPGKESGAKPRRKTKY